VEILVGSVWPLILATFAAQSGSPQSAMHCRQSPSESSLNGSSGLFNFRPQILQWFVSVSMMSVCVCDRRTARAMLVQFARQVSKRDSATLPGGKAAPEGAECAWELSYIKKP
jgi:hypothetical protein